MKHPRIFAAQLGCAKNQVDGEHMLAELYSAGFVSTENAEKADFLLINTCGFIEDAKTESINTVLSFIEAKKPSQKLIVTGCLSGRYMEELPKEMPEVDYWLGTSAPGKILKVLGLGEKASGTENLARLNLGDYKHHAYLQVAERCDRRCAFYAIPNISGKQISISIESIIQEAKELEAQGVQELTLIAQDTTFYGHDQGCKTGPSLAKLLKAVLKETNIPWIRTLYWYPEFIDDELLDLMANEPRICKYVDMPIQHASSHVLKLMRRSYNQQSLRKMLTDIRTKIPGVTLRTTVLVGFPGETQEDFEELMQLIQDVRFEHLGGFVFSPEEGTPAMKLKEEPVPEELARARLDAIQDLQEEISSEANEALIGKEVKVLIDEVAEESDYHFIGRTEGNSLDSDDIVKIVEGDANPGEFYMVKIIDAEPHELIGRIVSHA